MRGEVRFDAGSRALYATDASNYRQVPIGLVIPLDEADVAATIAACREVGAPVLPRGAGTSLAGQCCNVAVDHGFLEVPEPHRRARRRRRKVARVQPGIVLDRVRDAAEVHHLTFAPDPGDAQPLHARRHDRQQLVRRPCADGRQDRRQHPRARRDAVRRHADDRRAGRATPSSTRIIARRRPTRGRFTRASRASAIGSRRSSARSFRASRAACPATTSTSCCLKTDSMSPARSSAARARASPCSKRRCGSRRARRSGVWSASAFPTRSSRPITCPTS